MLRKTIIALVAAASVGMLAPTVALARGGAALAAAGASTAAAVLVAAAFTAAALVVAVSTPVVLVVAVSTPVVLVVAVSTLAVLVAQPLLAVADFTAGPWQAALRTVTAGKIPAALVYFRTEAAFLAPITGTPLAGR